MLTLNKHLMASVDHAFLKPWKNLNSPHNEFILSRWPCLKHLNFKYRIRYQNDSLECGIRKGGIPYLHYCLILVWRKLTREVIIKPGGTFFNRSKQYVTYAEFVTTVQNNECRRKCLYLQAYKTTYTQNQTLNLQTSNKLKMLLTTFHPMNKSVWNF